MDAAIVGSWIISAVGIGIISGLLTAAIVFVFRVLWLQVIQPWYEERVYRDVRIEGRWNIVYPGKTMAEIADLRRKGHRAFGSITTTDGPDKGKTFTFEGTFKNLILSLSYSSMNNCSLDRGMFALMLKSNGQRFEGHSAFYEDTEHAIDSAPCVWTRTDA